MAASYSTAGTKLAGVPELVEKILLNLTLRDILPAQRVDRTWKALIESSSKLQRALFFRPVIDDTLIGVGGPTDFWDCTSDIDCKRDLPKGEAQDDDFEDDDDYERRTYWIDDSSGHKFGHRAFVNNLALTKLVNVTLSLAGRRSGILGFFVGSKVNIGEAMSRKEASWRRMLLIQPPVTQLPIDNFVDHWHILKAAKGARGVTMQDLQNHILAFGKDLAAIDCKQFYFVSGDREGEAQEILALHSHDSE